MTDGARAELLEKRAARAEAAPRQQRQMVPPLERDECGPIGCRERCRPRVGAERRLQPLAKATLGVLAQAEAIRQVTAKSMPCQAERLCGA